MTGSQTIPADRAPIDLRKGNVALYRERDCVVDFNFYSAMAQNKQLAAERCDGRDAVLASRRYVACECWTARFHSFTTQTSVVQFNE